MERIETTIIGSTTIRKIYGAFSYDELIAALQDCYTGSKTIDWIWDLSEASAKQMTSADMQRLASFASANAHDRPKGKTAIVVPTDLGFGMGRMLETYGQFADVPFQVRIFRTQSQALQWMSDR